MSLPIEALRDAYHELESRLDALALSAARSGTEVSRESLGEVCLTAQLLDDPERDARFDFREDARRRQSALRFSTDERGRVRVWFRAEGESDYRPGPAWAWFDTLSKLLMLEGAEACGACS